MEPIFGRRHQEEAGLAKQRNRIWGAKPGDGVLGGASRRRVQRAPHTAASAVEHVGVDHRGADVTVAEQLLDGAHVVAVFEEVSRERMTQRMAARTLTDPRSVEGFLECALHDRFVQVMALAFADDTFEVETLGRKDPLPGPLSAGARILPRECVR